MHKDPQTQRLAPDEAVHRVFKAPIVLLSLLGEAAINVNACPDRQGAKTWHFRFPQRSVLIMSEDGAYRWVRAQPPLRASVEPLIEAAQQAARHSRIWIELLKDRGDVIQSWAWCPTVDAVDAPEIEGHIID